MSFVNLLFALEIDDGWPPVAQESLVFTPVGKRLYRLEVAPLFVKDLSVGDVLEVDITEGMEVIRWAHEFRSQRSTVWIMDFGDPKLPDVIAHLLSIQCNVEELKQFKYFAIDVPVECSRDEIEFWLDTLDEETAPVAYPSYRHEPEE